MSIAFRNATIVTQDDKRSIIEGDVYVEDHLIQQVGGRAPEADQDFDLQGHVLMPGLINLHTHLPMGLFRGYGDDMQLEDWLQNRIWPAEAKLDEESMRAGANLGLLEMVENGVTSFLDMYFLEEEVIADATRQMGLRGWLGEGMVDVGQTDAGEANAKISKIEQFTKSTKNDPLIQGLPAPHGTYTCNPETYQEASRIAKEYEVPLHTHCSETRKEVYDVESNHGARPVGKIAEYGALHEHTVLAHCGWITKQEVQDIAQAKASVAHCPVSNMKLATGGTCPVPEFQEAGVNVGLGTDGAASNNGTDMFETMKFAALVQKQHRWDATILPAQRALDMATRDAAAALHRTDLGQIKVGATADIIALDFRVPQLTPRHDVVSHLVYAANGRDVTHTMVHGKLLLEKGRVSGRDDILRQAQLAAESLTR